MIFRRSIPIVLAVAVLGGGLTGPAGAQQKPGPSAQAIQMAKQIIEMKGSTSAFDPVVNGVIEYHRNLLIQSNPNISSAIEQVASKMMTDMQSRKLELQQQLARSYAENFTEQEMKDALAFYSTPLGKKLITTEPKAMEDAMKAADAWSRTFAEEVVAKMRDELRKRGFNVI
jgi:hypothetical protein